jgi:hypothetical protein
VTLVIPVVGEEPRKVAFPQASTDFACIALSIRVDIVGMADEAKVLTIQEVGRRGGVSRAKNLSSEQRREIARRAAQARWAKKTDTPDPTDPNSPDGEVERRGLGIMLSSRRPARSASSSHLSGRSRAAAA